MLSGQRSFGEALQPRRRDLVVLMFERCPVCSQPTDGEGDIGKGVGVRFECDKCGHKWKIKRYNVILFMSYDIKARDEFDAEGKAKDQFICDFGFSEESYKILDSLITNIIRVKKRFGKNV
jgi:hypothetical protein